MDLKKRTEIPQPSDSKAAPQLCVRTSLRGGQSVENCMNNLQYWQNEYYRWYNQVKGRKPLPC